MAFAIVVQKALVSNKPQLPKPKPPSAIFPMKKVLPDGRTVWVSVPKPDKLSILVPISPDIYGGGVSKDVPVGVFANGLHGHLVSELFNSTCLDPGPTYPAPMEAGASKSWKWVILAMGVREAAVHIELAGSVKKGLSLRIECNPRKLGKAGFAILGKVLGGPSAPFDLHGLINAARVTRLDICVDVVGVRMSELILWYKDEGKRSLYVGSDGSLETVQLHRKLPPPTPHGQNWPKKKTPNNPVGRVQLKAYDRVRERLAAQKPAPFGPAPVIRLERPLYRFKQLSLTSLPTLVNRLKDFRAGLVQSQISMPNMFWFQYVAARRAMSEQEACVLLGVQKQMLDEFRVGEMVPHSDLLNSQEVWAHWEAGLAQTGLLGFLHLN